LQLNLRLLRLKSVLSFYGLKKICFLSVSLTRSGVINEKNGTGGALLLNFHETYYKSFYQILTKGTKIFAFFVPFPFLYKFRFTAELLYTRNILMTNSSVQIVEDGRPKHECGICGIFGHEDASKLTYFGLYALQHRGQESAGIVASDDGKVSIHKAMGIPF